MCSLEKSPDSESFVRSNVGTCWPGAQHFQLIKNTCFFCDSGLVSIVGT